MNQIKNKQLQNKGSRDPYSQSSGHPRRGQSRSDDYDHFKSHPLEE